MYILHKKKVATRERSERVRGYVKTILLLIWRERLSVNVKHDCTRSLLGKKSGEHFCLVATIEMDALYWIGT